MGLGCFVDITKIEFPGDWLKYFAAEVAIGNCNDLLASTLSELVGSRVIVLNFDWSLTIVSSFAL